VAETIDRLIDRNLEIEFRERHAITDRYTGPALLNFDEVREEVRYVIRENMKHWIRRWAFDEIAQELKGTK